MTIFHNGYISSIISFQSIINVYKNVLKFIVINSGIEQITFLSHRIYFSPALPCRYATPSFNSGPKFPLTVLIIGSIFCSLKKTSNIWVGNNLKILTYFLYLFKYMLSGFFLNFFYETLYYRWHSQMIHRILVFDLCMSKTYVVKHDKQPIISQSIIILKYG